MSNIHLYLCPLTIFWDLLFLFVFLRIFLFILFLLWKSSLYSLHWPYICYMCSICFQCFKICSNCWIIDLRLTCYVKKFSTGPVEQQGRFTERYCTERLDSTWKILWKAGPIKPRRGLERPSRALRRGALPLRSKSEGHQWSLIGTYTKNEVPTLMLCPEASRALLSDDNVLKDWYSGL